MKPALESFLDSYAPELESKIEEVKPELYNTFKPLFEGIETMFSPLIGFGYLPEFQLSNIFCTDVHEKEYFISKRPPDKSGFEPYFRSRNRITHKKEKKDKNSKEEPKEVIKSIAFNTGTFCIEYESGGGLAYSYNNMNIWPTTFVIDSEGSYFSRNDDKKRYDFDWWFEEGFCLFFDKNSTFFLDKEYALGILQGLSHSMHKFTYAVDNLFENIESFDEIVEDVTGNISMKIANDFLKGKAIEILGKLYVRKDEIPEFIKDVREDVLTGKEEKD